jgi:hypothetical protein
MDVGGRAPGPRAVGGEWQALVAAAFAYFGVVFCIGFVIGAVRTLVVAPIVGEVSAEGLDAAIMLAVYWVGCGWSLRHFEVKTSAASRLAMGAIAFGLLMAAEFAVARLLFARAAVTVFQSYGTPAGAIRLAAQLGFAATPFVRSRLALR